MKKSNESMKTAIAELKKIIEDTDSEAYKIMKAAKKDKIPVYFDRYTTIPFLNVKLVVPAKWKSIWDRKNSDLVKNKND